MLLEEFIIQDYPAFIHYRNFVISSKVRIIGHGTPADIHCSFLVKRRVQSGYKVVNVYMDSLEISGNISRLPNYMKDYLCNIVIEKKESFDS